MTTIPQEIQSEKKRQEFQSPPSGGRTADACHRYALTPYRKVNDCPVLMIALPVFAVAFIMMIVLGILNLVAK